MRYHTDDLFTDVPETERFGSACSCCHEEDDCDCEIRLAVDAEVLLCLTHEEVL